MRAQAFPVLKCAAAKSGSLHCRRVSRQRALDIAHRQQDVTAIEVPPGKDWRESDRGLVTLQRGIQTARVLARVPFVDQTQRFAPLGLRVAVVRAQTRAPQPVKHAHGSALQGSPRDAERFHDATRPRGVVRPEPKRRLHS